MGTYLPQYPHQRADRLYVWGDLHCRGAGKADAGRAVFWLLEEEGQALGFASFSVKEAAGQVYKLNKIYLLPQTQGKGYGKVLLEAVEQEVQRRGAAVLDLNVNRYNQAKGFYERCGYRVHLQEDIPIGPYWMNDYVMRKALQ